MTLPPDDRRPRRNSDASECSFASQFTNTWNGLIPPPLSYHENPLSHYLEDNQRLEGLFCAPASDDHYRPRNSDQSDDNDSTITATEDCDSTIYNTRMLRNRRSMYSTLSAPTLEGGGTSSASASSLPTMYNQPMYNLSSDTFGNPYTNRFSAGRPFVVHTRQPRGAMYRCLFAFDGCMDTCTQDTWKAHVNAHLSDVEPPESCTCFICGESFKSGIVTWSRFLDHILHHKYAGIPKPDQEFIEFCRDNDIISEYTRGRYGANLAAPMAAPDPHRHRQREHESFHTPRTIVSDNIARVDYPSEWRVVDSGMQRAIAGDIVVNRSAPRARGGRRS